MENKFLLMKTIMPLSAVLEHLCAVSVILSLVYCIKLCTESGRAHMHVGGCTFTMFYACVCLCFYSSVCGDMSLVRV